MQAPSMAANDTSLPGPHRLPGDLVMWLFILMELTVFAMMFLLFSWMRSSERELFLAGQQLLHPQAGLINTLALISASGLVAQGVIDNRRQRQRRAALWLFGSLLAASVYVLVKCWEYWQLGSAGYGLSSNHFFMGYFLLTGFHLMHVLLGMVILAYMALKLRRHGYGPDDANGLESGACYWHMVDLVWVLLFPIVYVIR
ncbi:cytochrome c oxidase subunit 3 [Marinobacterium arenosum]|uniref:cytochrome c oxidase subunit 3 n=1 Tax=Marinobacterium arenosum TaxID=2862496 RepID=UPI001C9791A5|nr:cytochrome c oxidase subunit 3 [Marinobacterium arenosum]MBY4678097.1 cytochrome c oxidase subunit 3 [Marinobacterium arenosum]